jgi:hypothetical protein
MPAMKTARQSTNQPRKAVFQCAALQRPVRAARFVFSTARPVAEGESSRPDPAASPITRFACRVGEIVSVGGAATPRGHGSGADKAVRLRLDRSRPRSAGARVRLAEVVVGDVKDDDCGTQPEQRRLAEEKCRQAGVGRAWPELAQTWPYSFRIGSASRARITGGRRVWRRPPVSGTRYRLADPNVLQ